MAEEFPVISGKNLNKEKIVIPDDYSAKNLIAIVAFQKWHQNSVDQTIEKFEQNSINETHHIIEVPVIQRTSWLRQIRLDTMMRTAIRDPKVRQRTITIYLDKQEFLKKLNIKNEESIHWFLIDHVSKTILMRGIGVVSLEEIRNIISTLDE